jgi:hypothetical protein
VPNRLAASTSPYLQQHATNPVDWYEWGEEAFAEARRRDVPVLVSIGYAACHWCHVMAHESFEDEATAVLMNTSFVNIKVDREERPDVDAVYMEVTQAITGRGGWPMTVFTTPDGEPFYAGTYFPPQPVSGMPAFRQVLAALADAWRDHRDQLHADAATIRASLVAAVREVPPGTVDPGTVGPSAGDPGTVDPETVDPGAGDRALDALAPRYDAEAGGFGRAPKFPPSTVLEWLLRRHARTGDPQALAMAEHTLDRMARGGMYDQLGGGFARYSVDRQWVVPHFEKMLYDNAQLLRVYAHWWRSTGSPFARRVTEETADFLLSELRTSEGGFASSLDADSPDGRGHSREGAFYTWTPAELTEALGPDDAAWAAAVLGVTDAGTFEAGSSVLQLRTDPDDAERSARVRAALMAARARRARPGRDDKVVAAWNGLAIAALADAGALLERPDWVTAARTAALLLFDVHLAGPGGARPASPDDARPASPDDARPATPDDARLADAEPARRVRLARTSRDGVVGRAPGVLDDYANVAEGFLALAAATGEAIWFTRAGALLDAVLARFGDGAGGFFDTADDATDPVLTRLRRPRQVGDGPTPSGQAAAAGALLTYGALAGSVRHRAAAERALTEPLLVAERYPEAAGWALAVAEAVLDGPREVAVVGAADDPGTIALVRAARLARAPGAVLACGEPSGGVVPERGGAVVPELGADVGVVPEPGVGVVPKPGVVPEPGVGVGVVPLLRDRPLVDGRPTAYVCRGFVCDRPVTDPAALAALLTP